MGPLDLARFIKLRYWLLLLVASMVIAQVRDPHPAATIVVPPSPPAAVTVQAPVGGQLGAGDPFAGACRPVVTQPYGPTDVEGEPIIGGVRFHTGIDLACAAGTPIHTISSGVAHVTYGYGGGFGNNVVVEVAGYFVRYAHLEAVVVADGAALQAEQVIGREGSTGFSTGPHLHFEVDQGAASVYRSINPGPYLAGA